MWCCGKTPEAHFYMNFIRFVFFYGKEKKSLMLSVTIDFTFSFCGFVNRIIERWVEKLTSQYDEQYHGVD